MTKNIKLIGATVFLVVLITGVTAFCAETKAPVTSSVPLIGEAAPSFVAETTQGEIKFPEDFKGKWVILFSHPADFTPVCTTEFMTFAKMMPELKL